MRLVFAFVAFVAFVGYIDDSFATSASVNSYFATSVPVVGSCVRLLCNFFIGSILLLKLLKTFSLTLANNIELILYFFQNSSIY